MAPAVSIIVPVYNAFEAAARCLESVYRARTDISFEVIAVDNGSDGRFDEYLGPARTAYRNLRPVRFPEPLGFPRAANEGARRARHEYLVLLNSDTLVTDWWLDGLVNALTVDPGLAMVGPVTNRCGNDAQVGKGGVAVELSLVVPEPQLLTFFCVMIRRSVWERLAGLDEVYRSGYSEDDDFCLRTRLAGYRLGVVPGVFIFHEANRTFEANRLNMEELLARNRNIFLSRASRWSRSLGPATATSIEADSISVIVPVLSSAPLCLRDSLVSLCNQTVGGFETVLIHPADVDVSQCVAETSGRLRIVTETLSGTPDGLAPLLNAGLAASRGRRIAYLLPGDLFYPFHIEVLSQALDRSSLDAAYCAWSVYSDMGGKERRGAVSFDQLEPIRLPWGDWAPLASWMHQRAATPPGCFDESLRHFPGWHFVLRLAQRSRFQFLRRITVERHVRPAPPFSQMGAVAEAGRILPAAGAPWQDYHRKAFLDAVRTGCWEQHLVIDKNKVEQRARHLVGAAGLARFSAAQTEAAHARLAATQLTIPPADASELPNIFLFSIIEWTALTQRPQHFARGLTARGYRVVWIDIKLKQPRLMDPHRLASEIAPGLHYVELPGDAAQIDQLHWSPAILDLMALVIERMSEMYPARSAIQLVTFPKWTPLAKRLRARFGWPIVYDCLDDQRAFSELFKQDASAFEDELIQASSVLITAARSLFDRHQGHDANTKLLPNGAAYEIFRNAKPGGFLDHLPRPVIGFFGAFSDWLDIDWIVESARYFPHWSFVYIGRDAFGTEHYRERWRDAITAPNITVLPQMDLPRLASYLAEFDVCIMPFQDLPITLAMNPVKLYEYLAAGKPVVAPDLPETRPLAEQGLIATYTSREQSFCLLREAAFSPGSESQLADRDKFAAANAWSQRLDVLTAVFSGLSR